MEIVILTLSNRVATNHMWLSSTSNVASMTEKKANFIFYLILLILNVNSHLWLVATILIFCLAANLLPAKMEEHLELSLFRVPTFT